MIIETTQALTTLEGKPLKSGEEDLTIGKAIAEALLANKTGGRMKVFLLAKKFFSDEKVELDNADFALVKESVKTAEVYAHQGFNTLVFGQIEEILEELK